MQKRSSKKIVNFNPVLIILIAIFERVSNSWKCVTLYDIIGNRKNVGKVFNDTS